MSRQERELPRGHPSCLCPWVSGVVPGADCSTFSGVELTLSPEAVGSGVSLPVRSFGSSLTVWPRVLALGATEAASGGRPHRPGLSDFPSVVLLNLRFTEPHVPRSGARDLQPGDKGHLLKGHVANQTHTRSGMLKPGWVPWNPTFCETPSELL